MSTDVKGRTGTARSLLRTIRWLFTRVRFLGKAIRIPTSSTVSRKAILSWKNGGNIIIGKRTHIHPYAILQTHGGNITLGNDCTVNPFTVLYGHGNLNIGDGVRIAAHCVIIPAQHRFNELDKPMHEQGISSEGIIIEDNVWIGANCTILDGVRIGKNSVIGAGSVVTKSIPHDSIAVGVPAHVLRSRTD
jgi:acetyltransferase-like isoleucine patch superfamily enzyme